MSTLGTAASLWRYPVKSMEGEPLPEAELRADGVVGDRAFGLLDATDGKVASAKNPRKWGRLLDFAASYEPSGEAAIRFPDGRTRSTADASLDEELSAALGRPVHLARAAPAQPVFEEYWPDIEGLAPPEFVASTPRVSGEDPSETITEMPLALAAPPGTFFDLSVLHLITTATLARLTELYSHGTFAARRYRPNVLIDTGGASGFVENKWVGRTFRLGDEATVRVQLAVPRCVMTTLAQGPLPRDPGLLRTIARNNRVEIAGYGRFACAGVYAEVLTPGVVRAGDPIEVC